MARAASPTPRNGDRRPCVGLIETCSIAVGYKTADAVLWQSEVELLFCEPVSPGKFVMLFTGEVDSVAQSLRRGMETAGADLTDKFLIPNLETSVFEAICGRFGDAQLDAIGIIETSTVASAIVAADVSVKTAVVVPVELRLANQLGGKAFVTLVGEIGDVRAA
ncbi:MAG: BMC domain-containing protein, partial [Planctomycetota bacterium]